MHSSMSMIQTILERVRFWTDDPTINAKYSDAFIVQHLLYPSLVDVLARLNLNQDNPIVIRYSFSLVINQQYYQLPPCIQEIWRIAILDESGRILQDMYPRGVFHPRGQGWSIEGNVLSFLPFPQSTDTFDIWYVPSADVLYHYGTGTLRNNVFTLAASPTLGLLDRRPNAYAGQILRLIPSTGVVQEHIIESYDPQTRQATLRMPFTEDASGGSSSSSGAGSSESSSSSGGFSDTYLYEIAPIGSQALYEAIGVAVSIKLSAAKSVSDKKMAYLEKEYKKAMKTIMDNLANLQMRTGKAFDKNTIDNNEQGRFLFPGGSFGWGTR